MKNIIYLILIFGINLTLVAQTKNILDDDRKIRIPVVFHVIYTDAQQSISDSLIINELKDLNLDFSNRNDKSVLDNEFENLVGNPNVEFYLLDSIFQSNQTKGINRISSSLNTDRTSLLLNPVNCVNVFIADQGNSSDILSNRINLNYRDVGLNTHVLTHEMGHWLGLYHIWGKLGSCNWFKALFSSKDDGIDDTPKQFKCTDLSFSKACPPDKKLTYKDHKILYNNFMDYSGCRCMFTLGQSTKMRNNIIENKPLLFDQ